MFDHPAFDAHEVSGRVSAPPDYVIDAGGIISVGREYLGGGSAASIEAESKKIPERLTEIFARSRAENRPTSDLADELAKRPITQA